MLHVTRAAKITQRCHTTGGRPHSSWAISLAGWSFWKGCAVLTSSAAAILGARGWTCAMEYMYIDFSGKCKWTVVPTRYGTSLDKRLVPWHQTSHVSMCISGFPFWCYDLIKIRDVMIFVYSRKHLLALVSKWSHNAINLLDPKRSKASGWRLRLSWYKCY